MEPPSRYWSENDPNYEMTDCLPAYNAPSAPAAPPPDYETAVGILPATQEAHAIANHDPITLRIDGKYIYSSLSETEPVYSLSHELDGHELSANGILVTRIDRRGTRTIKRDIFALRHASPLHIGPAKYEIDGLRLLSGKRGHMARRVTRKGPGWAVVGGQGLPSLSLRPTSMLSSDARLYEWRDNDSDQYIATETRRRWDKDKKIEVSTPTMQLRIGANVDKNYLDFFVAAWCMHNWREAKELTKEPLTWEEFKGQARVTASKHRSRRWNAAFGAPIF